MKRLKYLVLSHENEDVWCDIKINVYRKDIPYS